MDFTLPIIASVVGVSLLVGIAWQYEGQPIAYLIRRDWVEVVLAIIVMSSLLIMS